MLIPLTCMLCSVQFFGMSLFEFVRQVQSSCLNLYAVRTLSNNFNFNENRLLDL